MSDDSSFRAFAEQLLELLDRTSTSSTYKHAVLLALMEVCAERTDRVGRTPPSIRAGELAPKVVELYWRQARPFGSTVLRQNTTGQAEIVRMVVDARTELGSRSLATLRLAEPERMAQLERDVRWKLIQMPLPRLQVVDRRHDPFVYAIGWTTDVGRRTAEAADFDDRLVLTEAAREHLVAMAPLLRPLLERSWALVVARFNRLGQDDLDQFLFGAERRSLVELAGPLHEAAGGRCFYCDGRIPGRGDVDHFIPWSRHFDDGLDNLVIAHPRCNNAKRDHLAAEHYVERWVRRFDATSRTLVDLADARRWTRHSDRTLAIARSTYLTLPDTARGWSHDDGLRRLDLDRIRAALSSVDVEAA